MDQADWMWETKSQIELRTATSWENLCGEDDLLENCFQDGWTPTQFCDWFIEKYDLIELSL